MKSSFLLKIFYILVYSTLESIIREQNFSKLKHFPSGKPELFSMFLDKVMGFDDSWQSASMENTQWHCENHLMVSLGIDACNDWISCELLSIATWRNWRKCSTIFKNMFWQFLFHLQFWLIQNTKLNLKCITKCLLDKTQ